MLRCMIYIVTTSDQLVMEISFDETSFADTISMDEGQEIIPGSLLDVSCEVEVDINNNSESDEIEAGLFPQSYCDIEFQILG